MLNFQDLGLNSDTLKGISQAGFTQASDVQSKIIPLALENKDLICQANTGTGKTAKFHTAYPRSA